MKEGELTEKEKRLLSKGFKKKKDAILFYREFELRDIADLLITKPEDVPLSNLPWADISKEIKKSKIVGEESGSIRSYDDCKNEWKNVIYPVLSQTSCKDKRADIKLLTHIID
mmetsp:Transcript_26787/g.26699  ORF Transcript_26787/g.26699 Transcript_26787/m.26699 type:complete len:113 (-) Transcript_26787:29-367(-)